MIEATYKVHNHKEALELFCINQAQHKGGCDTCPNRINHNCDAVGLSSVIFPIAQPKKGLSVADLLVRAGTLFKTTTFQLSIEETSLIGGILENSDIEAAYAVNIGNGKVNIYDYYHNTLIATFSQRLFPSLKEEGDKSVTIEEY